MKLSTCLVIKNNSFAFHVNHHFIYESEKPWYVTASEFITLIWVCLKEELRSR